jgi:hypothetical protein
MNSLPEATAGWENDGDEDEVGTTDTLYYATCGDVNYACHAIAIRQGAVAITSALLSVGPRCDLCLELTTLRERDLRLAGGR